MKRLRLYAYRCLVCGKTTEFLMKSGEEKKPECPACGSDWMVWLNRPVNNGQRIYNQQKVRESG